MYIIAFTKLDVNFRLMLFKLNLTMQKHKKNLLAYIVLQNTFMRHRDITFVESEHELDCLDSGRHEDAACRNVNR